jgi:hypothetical protein
VRCAFPIHLLRVPLRASPEPLPRIAVGPSPNSKEIARPLDIGCQAGLAPWKHDGHHLEIVS